MTQHPIQTQLPNDDFLALKLHCAQVDRSQAWVAREAIREHMKQLTHKPK